MFSPDKHIQLGAIYREHGVKGFCKAHIFGSSDDNLEEGRRYTLVSVDGQQLESKLESISSVGRYFLLKFDAFRSPEQIEAWRKAGIWIAKADLNRADGEVYDYEWEGLILQLPDGRVIGKIVSITYMPLKQFVVQPGSGESFLVPYTPPWIVSVDRERKVVVMDLPEGLWEVG